MMNLKGLSANTVSITDFEVINSRLAKVVVAFTGKYNKDTIQASIAAKLSNLGAVVENSFRQINSMSAVGFVRANREVRVVSSKVIEASYKVMSSNILMSKEDETLWEMKTGAGGTYLARHGSEDLSELVASATSRRTDVPSLRVLASPTAAKRELVAFVDASGDMDYGFAVAGNDTKVKVVSFAQRAPAIVSYSNVVAIYPAKIDRSLHAKVLAGLTEEQKANEIEYWKQLYSYGPEFLEETIRQVEEDAVA